MKHLILVGGILHIVLLGLTVAQDDYGTRLLALRAQVVKGIESFDQSMTVANPEPEVRELACAGFCILALNQNPSKAIAYFNNVFSAQEMDPRAINYGDVAWRVNHPEMRDTNSIEFTIVSMLPALLRYSNKLSSEFQAEAVPHLRGALAAVRRHLVPVTYTNIYLMKLANLIMLGEYLKDNSAIEEGKTDLDVWISWVRAHGVDEFDSPTYAFVQLTDLEDVYINPPDERSKQRAKIGLDYLWADLAANYFPGRDSIGGPHSRSYDFLFQKGTIQKYYYLEGLAPTLSGSSYLGGPWLNGVQDGDYHPAPSILKLATIPDRLIQQRCGIELGRDRFNHITPDFAIGSISAYYGPQDVQISVEFVDSPGRTLPVSSVVLDAWDAPWGKATALDSAGHVKPKHLQELIASVQADDRVLALMELVPDLQHPQESVGTDIVLPMKADEVWLDHQKLPNDKAFGRPVTPNSVVFVRQGKAVAGFRIFAADGAGGQQPVMEVKYDGNKWGAGRLVAYHYQGKPRVLEQHPVRSGVFIAATRCPDNAAFENFVDEMEATKIQQELSGGDWSATVSSGGKKLEAAMDLEHRQIAWRRIDGQEISPRCLLVNGRDLGEEILGITQPEYLSR